MERPTPFATSTRVGAGTIEGSFFEVQEQRGVVVLVPPWVPQGGSWFYRHGRVEAVRDAGYSALVVDLPGIRRGRRGPGFYDREIRALLDDARTLAQGQPLYLWGVSSGGYWSHLALAAGAVVEGAVFEDVAVHLLLWAHREAPQWAHFYRVFERFLTRAWPFLDIRAHAAYLGVEQAVWISGELDRAVLPAETEELARLGGGRAVIVPGAGHLGSMRLAPDLVLGAAFEVFERQRVEVSGSRSAS